MREEKTLELHIEINKEIKDYNSFCAFLTGVVGEYYEQGIEMQSNYGIDEKRKYKKEEVYNFEFILRKEYEGFYVEPSICEKNILMIYLNESLTEEELEIIKRRLKTFSEINNFEVISVKEVNAIVTYEEVKSIDY